MALLIFQKPTPIGGVLEGLPARGAARKKSPRISFFGTKPGEKKRP
jgi:hypothetical protein